jgi:type IV secretion system protein VirB10
MTWFTRRASVSNNPVESSVRGERSLSALSLTPSIHAMISNAVAMGLVLSIGLGLLAWYYVHTSSRQSQARQNAQAASRGRAQGETLLPPLGPIAAPSAASLTGAATASDVTPGRAEPVGVPVPASAVAPRAVSYGGYVGEPARDGSSPRQSSLERRLSGAAYVHENGAGSQGADSRVVAPAPANAGAVALGSETGSPVSSASPLLGSKGAAADGALSPWLRADHASVAVSAHVLPTQRLILAKGAFIDCTLETAIDSTLPGMTTCVTATDTFGVDGKVVLLERGTKLVGETRGQVQQGAARVFVLWTEARTPTGVIVPLDSPGADELGRAGLPGTMERHFWERFGAALVISTIDGAVQAGVQSVSRGNGTIIYNPSATQDVTTESLKGTLNIPPTVLKRNGDRIQVLVARDIDFTSVYELRHARFEP